MKIVTKPGVNTAVSPVAHHALQIAIGIAREMDFEEFRWTSGKRNRGYKSNLSMHDIGNAVDFVLEPKKDAILAIFLERYCTALGDDYDVIYHNVKTGFHFHSEYDPRR